MKNASTLGAIHAILWLVAVVLIQTTFVDSSARDAYGLLCAWWVTLYAGLLFGTTLRALPAFLGCMAVLLILDTLLGTSWLYHDAPSPISAQFIGLIFLLSVLWSSPIVVNTLIRYVRDRLSQND
jgi:hypothetical protein